MNCLKKTELLENINKFNVLTHQKLTTANKFFNPDKVFSFRSSPIIRYVNNLDELVKDLYSWLENGYKVFITAGDEKQAKFIQKRLENKYLKNKPAQDTYVPFNPINDRHIKAQEIKLYSNFIK